jgi:hypothetical protein
MGFAAAFGGTNQGAISVPGFCAPALAGAIPNTTTATAIQIPFGLRIIVLSLADARCRVTRSVFT